MSVVPTYPGIYIEEIPSSVHTIVAAPTNIAVFVGYSHPFKTAAFNTAVLCFGFTDYQAAFGGFFSGALFSPNPTADPNDFFGSLPLAVSQFFLNGGTECYVVGLQAEPAGPLTPGGMNLSGIAFTAREPTDSTLNMSVTITPKPTAPISVTSPPSSPPSSPPAQVTSCYADITITYVSFNQSAGVNSSSGAVVEVYRKVNYADIATTIGTAANPVSNLVTVSQPATTSPPSMFTGGTGMMGSMSPLSPALSITNAFNTVFAQDSSLDTVPVFNLMVLPGVVSNIILSEALRFCELKRAFLIIDPPQYSGITASATATPPISYIGDYARNGDEAPLAPNAAIYFPYLQSNDPESGDAIEIPPAPTVAGIFAQTDLSRGVWKAPAGLATTILGTTGPVTRGLMSDARQGLLNPIGINCLRAFPNIGTVVFGARTSCTANTAQQQWQYVPVRRMALFLEQTLYANLGWVVFEPNAQPLWTAIVSSIEAFMLGLFRQGAFQGTTPSDAFQVQCDDQTTTQADIDSGKVNILVAFAPLKPAEFVIVQIAQLAGQSSS